MSVSTFCSQIYRKKHQSGDPKSQKENFFTKEKQFTIGHKKVTINGTNIMSVKLTNKNLQDATVDVGQGGMYSEQQFRELRESILEL